MNEQSPTPNPSEAPPPLPGVHTAGEILPGMHLSTLKLLSEEEGAERERRREAEQRWARIAELEGRCKAPKRQWNRQNLNRSGPWGQTEMKIREKLGKDGLFVGLVGLRGNGKTQLAVE